MCASAEREVFYIDGRHENAAAALVGCGQHGARLASLDEIRTAHSLKSQVCSWGYTSSVNAQGVSMVAFPMQAPSPCSSGLSGFISKEACTPGWNNCAVGAACHGVRPANGTANVRPWNEATPQWSLYTSESMSKGVSEPCPSHNAQYKTQPDKLIVPSLCAISVCIYCV